MKRLAAAVAVVALTLSACGGGGGRPSASEIESALNDTDNPVGEQVADTLTEEQISCVAEAFEASDLSDDALQSLVDGDESYEGSDEDEAALQDILTEDLTECATAE
ncbi:hypothetical protein [Nocardioides nanhaiensis]|uniref:DUF732 domain-containing protein n=1 Tax=Nocardioides nanhaiensis TaxID=1476871 RepID=A0ABP8WCH8_9ACTN